MPPEDLGYINGRNKMAIVVADYVLVPLLWVMSIFLIILVLIQRGRGGGLAGALGGMGGQSAFGAKAGDTFTRITVIVAGAWILICVILFFIYSHDRPSGGQFKQGASQGPNSWPRSVDLCY
jgi:protein translocase SecG subunit